MIWRLRLSLGPGNERYNWAQKSLTVRSELDNVGEEAHDKIVLIEWYMAVDPWPVWLVVPRGRLEATKVNATHN